MYVAQGSGPCSCIRVAITTRQASAVTRAKYSILHYLGSLILYGVHASKGHAYYI